MFNRFFFSVKWIGFLVCFFCFNLVVEAFSPVSDVERKESLIELDIEKKVKKKKQKMTFKARFKRWFWKQLVKKKTPIIAHLSLGFIITVPPLAIIFGIASLIKINNAPYKWKGKWLAWIGIVLGVVLSVLYLRVILFLISRM